MQYVVVPNRSSFAVRAFAAGMLARLGHNPVFAVQDYRGEISWAQDEMEKALVQIIVRAASLRVANANNPTDRDVLEKRTWEEVLEVKVHPEIGYEASVTRFAVVAENWYRLWLTGRLQLHGVTKSHPVELQLRVVEDELRLSGQSTVLQSAYGISRPTALGGLVDLKDEVIVDFDIVCMKKGY